MSDGPRGGRVSRASSPTSTRSGTQGAGACRHAPATCDTLLSELELAGPDVGFDRPEAAAADARQDDASKEPGSLAEDGVLFLGQQGVGEERRHRQGGVSGGASLRLCAAQVALQN